MMSPSTASQAKDTRIQGFRGAELGCALCQSGGGVEIVPLVKGEKERQKESLESSEIGARHQIVQQGINRGVQPACVACCLPLVLVEWISWFLESNHPRNQPRK